LIALLKGCNEFIVLLSVKGFSLNKCNGLQLLKKREDLLDNFVSENEIIEMNHAA